jgi:pyridoxal 5'-phosphate synthase pdxT subunit
VTAAPLVGVLALQGGFAAHVRVLRSLGAEVREVRTPRDLDGLDGLVMPGGESTTMTLGIEREGLADPLRAFHAAGKPIFGTCAGLILLDRGHLGLMDIVAERNAFGRPLHSFEQDLHFPDMDGGPVRAVFIRAPWVETVGRGVEVLARVPSSVPGPASGKVVAVRQGAVMATAFHPEQTGDARLHDLFLRRVREFAA